VPERLDAKAIALMVLLTAIWGGSFTFVKVGLRDLPVFASLFLRLALAAALLAGYSRWARIPLRYDREANWFLAASAGAFVWGQALLYLGLTQTTAGRGSIFFNTQPFFTLLLLPLFVPEERLTARKWAGTALAFAGVVLLFLERAGGPGRSLWLGDLLTLLATLGWAASNVITKVMPRSVHPASLIMWGTAVAAPVSLVLTLTLEGGQPWRFTPTAVLSVVYLAAVAAAFSFVAFTWLIRHYSAIRVNAFVFLSPVWGVLIGWAFLGEPVSWVQLGGAVLVGGGILIVNTAVR
jgi:drug/metabolite transporter (DMT)-like permease